MSEAQKKTRAPGELAAGKPFAREHMYQTILGPVVTEKATLLSEQNQVTFRVPLEATKPQIRAAVEGLFNVDVLSVNTILTKGKAKRFRGREGQRADTKKAIVRLAVGQSIDLTTGLA